MTVRRIDLTATLLACFMTLGVQAQEPQTHQPPSGNADQPKGASGSQPQAAVSDIDKPYRIGGGVSAPKLTYQPEPTFSELARKLKLTGVTTLGLVVNAQGVPQNIRVVKSAADAYSLQKDRDTAQVLDAKAIEAVRQYRFKPAMRAGQPVPVEMRVEIRFEKF